jgi:hypothetical protein
MCAHFHCVLQRLRAENSRLADRAAAAEADAAVLRRRVSTDSNSSHSYGTAAAGGAAGGKRKRDPAEAPHDAHKEQRTNEGTATYAGAAPAASASINEGFKLSQSGTSNVTADAVTVDDTSLR